MDFHPSAGAHTSHLRTLSKIRYGAGFYSRSWQPFVATEPHIIQPFFHPSTPCGSPLPPVATCQLPTLPSPNPAPDPCGARILTAPPNGEVISQNNLSSGGKQARLRGTSGGSGLPIGRKVRFDAEFARSNRSAPPRDKHTARGAAQRTPATWRAETGSVVSGSCIRLRPISFIANSVPTSLQPALRERNSRVQFRIDRALSTLPAGRMERLPPEQILALAATFAELAIT